MHPCGLLLDLSDRFGRLGHLVPERLGVCPRLLGSPGRIRAVGIKVGHDGTVPFQQRSSSLPARRAIGPSRARGEERFSAEAMVAG